MWDTVRTTSLVHLSHDMQCPRCRHAAHTYLACSDSCDCEPPEVLRPTGPAATPALDRVPERAA
jgi:hypothetical protein